MAFKPQPKKTWGKVVYTVTKSGNLYNLNVPGFIVWSGLTKDQLTQKTAEYKKMTGSGGGEFVRQ